MSQTDNEQERNTGSPPMTGKFNIAVARFGELDASGGVQPSDDATLQKKVIDAHCRPMLEATETERAKLEG